MPADRVRWLPLAALLVVWLRPSESAAYCRTLTCKLPADWAPSLDACTPPGFADFCAAQNPPVTPLPLWWRNACVSYDVHRDPATGAASAQVPYDTAASIVAAAFSKWTGTQCSDGTSVGRVSVDVRDLGAVACDEVHYNSDQGNQHVILFRDHGFGDGGVAVNPLDANTLGLTTVTFNPDTGEIYDADMEINSAVDLALGDPVGPNQYDLQSIVTHEAGHFLGLAHSPNAEATMFYSYNEGSTSKRTLTADDMQGICSIYAPNGSRAVDPSVASSGVVPAMACDPTPRHGFQSQCSSPQAQGGCAVSAGRRPAPSGATLCGALGAAVLVAARRRARRSSRGAARASQG